MSIFDFLGKKQHKPGDLSDEDLKLKAIAVVIMVMATADDLTNELVKNVKDLRRISGEVRKKIEFILTYILFYNAQEFFWENVIKDDKIAKKFEELLFHYFKEIVNVDAKEYIKDIEDYIKKIGEVGKVQYAGSKICRFLKKEDAFLMLEITTVYATFLKHVYYLTLDNAWKTPNEKIRELMTLSKIDIKT